MTMLTLIRHAHAEAAIAGVVAGPKGDTGLGDRGRRQAVAHGGFISAVCLQLLGARISEPRGFLLSPAHTSMTTWTASDEREGLWRLDRYNDAAHLEGLE